MKRNKIKEEFYKARNLTDRDSMLMASISEGNLAAINRAIAAVETLKQNLEIYRSCVIDSVNLEAESADIASGYAQEQHGQTFTLPGVINPPAVYDIDQTKKDMARMSDIQSTRSKIVSQADQYLAICKGCVANFVQAWKAMANGDLAWKEFIFNLNNSINPNY